MASDPFSPRPTDKPQLTLEDMRTMHPLDVEQARKDGQFRDVLTNGDPERQRGPNKPRGAREPAQGRDWGDIVAARKSAKPTDGLHGWTDNHAVLDTGGM